MILRLSVLFILLALLLGGITQPVLALVFSARIIDVQQNSKPQETPLVSWNLTDKLAEARALLLQMKPKAGDTPIEFYEERFSLSDGKLSVNKKKLEEPELYIPLALLENNTGKVIPITVIKRGAELISPPDLPIQIVKRANGIEWNKWNTNFQAPAGYTVLMDYYPYTRDQTVKEVIKNKNGKSKTVTRIVKVPEPFLYAPYSKELNTPEIVEAGREYTKNLVTQALEDLRKKSIKSLAFKNTLVSDVPVFTPEFFQFLPIIEHADMTEFELNSRQSVERVLTIIGSNPETAFSKTGSPAGALGWVQYTNKTWQSIRKIYPQAGLTDDFESGAADHLMSMKAAILLYDYNLQGLMKRHGSSVAVSPYLQEYLTAAYNGSPTRVTRSLNAALASVLPDWIGQLARETQGYMIKLREMKALHIFES